MPDLEVLELRQLGANLQRLLCLNLSCVDDAMGDPAGVAASQSLLLLLETLQRIPVTWQLLQQSQIAVCVRACCQVQTCLLCLPGRLALCSAFMPETFPRGLLHPMARMPDSRVSTVMMGADLHWQLFLPYAPTRRAW